MKRPEKKEQHDINKCNCFAHSENECACGNYPSDRIEGYNQACSDWEKYCNEVVVKTIEEYAHDVIPKLNYKWRKRLEKTLPTVEEIDLIIHMFQNKHVVKKERLTNITVSMLSKAIYKRITKE